jgi:hypothetical protein
VILVDERFDEDHFMEVTLTQREAECLSRFGEFKKKVVCNGEIISFAIIIEFDKSAVDCEESRKEKKLIYR